MVDKETTITLAVVIPLVVIVLVVVIVYVTRKYIKFYRFRKKKNFQEVSFRDNPVMTGKLPDTPRNSEIVDVELGNNNDGYVTSGLADDENETSFTCNVQPESQSAGMHIERVVYDTMTVNQEEQCGKIVNGSKNIDKNVNDRTVEQKLITDTSCSEKVTVEEVIIDEKNISDKICDQESSGKQTANDDEVSCQQSNAKQTDNNHDVPALQNNVKISVCDGDLVSSENVNANIAVNDTMSGKQANATIAVNDDMSGQQVNDSIAVNDNVSGQQVNSKQPVNDALPVQHVKLDHTGTNVAAEKTTNIEHTVTESNNILLKKSESDHEPAASRDNKAPARDQTMDKTIEKALENQDIEITDEKLSASEDDAVLATPTYYIDDKNMHDIPL